jgi:hypothetical protein
VSRIHAYYYGYDNSMATDENNWDENLKIMDRPPKLGDDFTKIQDFPKFIVQPNETIQYDLHNFFRGQLLDYTISDPIPFD